MALIMTAGFVINAILVVIELLVGKWIKIVEFNYSDLLIIALDYELIFFIIFAVATGLTGIISIAFFHKVKPAEEDSNRLNNIVIIVSYIANIIAFIILDKMNFINSSIVVYIIMSLPLIIEEKLYDSDKIAEKFNLENKKK